MLRVLLARPDWPYRPCGYERRYGADRPECAAGHEARWDRPGLPVRRVLPVQPELLVRLV